MMVSTARTPNVMPTPMPAFALEDIPDDSGDPVVAEVFAVSPADVADVCADVADVREIVSLPKDDVEAELLDDEDVLTRGSTAAAVPAISGFFALKTSSSSLQQLVFRPVTPASSVPCGVQQNSFSGS